jgi:pimeloyl-ACP methyl ester carboxylesterase
VFTNGLSITEAQILTANGRKIAYHQTLGKGPCVVFLGGFMSDMSGTKAVYLEQWAKSQGRAFIRFDYSGHGQSSGEFANGCIGDWFADALAVVTLLASQPLILVGSSMGGWISLLLAKAIPERISGLVTIAAAPDFTTEMSNEFSDEQRQELQLTGITFRPSEYGDPYPITKRLIEDGRSNLVLNAPLELPFPTRFLQGDADRDVSLQTALRLLDHVTGPDICLTLVKGADHRFSDTACLALIAKTLQELP